jgi:alpha-beta hydrolase superfamily lysophospholipase
MGKGISEKYNFYALDLRKSGRSRLLHQHPGYVSHFETYFEEIHVPS